MDHIDKNGIHHPTKAHRIRYENWEPGMTDSLGQNPQKALEEIVHEYLTEVHDEHTESVATLQLFLAVEEDLIRQCWDRIEYYENFCTRYRKENNLRPFYWPNERKSSVAYALRAKRGKPIVPRTNLERIRAAEYAAIHAKDQNNTGPTIAKIPAEELLYQPQEHSCVSEAYAYYQKFGEYPERQTEGIDAVLEEIRQRHIQAGTFR